MKGACVMKWKFLFIMLVAIVLVTVVSDAVPTFINHGRFTRESVNNP
jgi:uncharacterized protein YpmS